MAENVGAAEVLPQISDHHRCLGAQTFHRIHRFQKQEYLQGGALVSSAPTELRWCTSCYVGALETSAPPEVSRFCEFCVFCGRHFAVAEAGDLRYYLPHPNHLCQSVKSVGEYPPAEGSVNSAYSVGDP